MINAYKEILLIVKKKLLNIDFRLIKNEDYVAIFSNNTNWRIIFEGERYYTPAYTLSIELNCDNNKKKDFALWLLIKVFEKNNGLVEKKYSLEQELDWLVQNKDKVFIESIPYEKDYNDLNCRKGEWV